MALPDDDDAMDDEDREFCANCAARLTAELIDAQEIDTELVDVVVAAIHDSTAYPIVGRALGLPVALANKQGRANVQRLLRHLNDAGYYLVKAGG